LRGGPQRCGKESRRGNRLEHGSSFHGRILTDEAKASSTWIVPTLGEKRQKSGPGGLNPVIRSAAPQ
jgi:hypothetical protein